MKVKWTALLIAGIAVIATVAALYFSRLGQPRSGVPVNSSALNSPAVSAKPKVCLLAARNGTGYAVSTHTANASCPSLWEYRVSPRRGWRLRAVYVVYWNGSRRAVPPGGSLRLGGNASLVVEVERVYVSLRILVNGSAPYLVNGSERRGNATLRVPLGARVNLTLLQGRWRGFKLAPLNRSTTVEATGNMTVHLYWLRRCQGVYVTSNVPVPGLPSCLQPPLTLSYGLAGPTINATHRYWLAWYLVEENGSRHWWSPGINGTKLHIPKPANITLHYIPGLKTLPYVLRVYKWPEAYVEHAGLKVWVEDGWAKAKANLSYMFAYIKGRKYEYYTYYYVLLLQAPPNVSLVEVEAYVPSGSGHFFFVPLAWGNFSAGLLVCGKGFLYVSNETRYNIDRLDADYMARGYRFEDLWPPYLEFHRSVPTRFRIIVNFTALREAWSRGLCDMPVRRIFPGSGVRGTFMESPISGTVNPVQGIYPDEAGIVYRWPSGDNLLVFIYLLLKGYGSPAPYIAARIVGVAP